MKRLRATWFTPGAGLFLCLLLALLAVGRERMLRDPGTFWHTVVGERIIQTGEWPSEDSFTFTAAGQKWLAQQWVGEIAMAVAHRIAGLDGLLLGTCAIISGIFAWLALRLRSAGLPWPMTIPLVLLGLGAASCHFMPRPHVASIALMAVCYGMLCEVDSARATSIRLLWLPALMVLWTNTHGAALGGLATILMVLLGWLFASRISRPLIGVTASLCILAILVNPYGPALPAVWVGLMRSDVLPRLIVEHAPLQLGSPEGMMVLALGAIYFVLLARARHVGWRVTWFVPLVWFLLALSRVRHGPLFAVTALVAIADMLRVAQAQGCTAAPYRSSARGWVLPFACVGLILLIQHLGIRAPLIGAGWARPGESYWPSTTVAALRDRLAESPANPRVFNDLLFGGYLVFTAPQARVFIDDRCELHGDTGLLEYARICRDPPRLVARCRYDDVRFALVAAGSKLDRFLRTAPHWRSVATDSAAALFERLD